MTVEFLEELKHAAPYNFLSKKEDLYVYAHDTSQNPEEIILPLAVVFPKNTNEVSNIVKIASKFGVSIVARAQGTNHCGATRPVKNSIVVHFSCMNKIISINKTNLTAIVEPNVVIGDLNKKLDKMGLFFPPDPSNLAVSTIGGAIGLCSGGPRTFKYGNTKNYIISLEVVLPNGEILKTSRDLSKNVTGYDLTSIFIGSEGTLGLVTKATLKLLPKPQTRLISLAYFDTLQEAAKCSNEIINKGLIPSTIDLIDKITLQTIEKFNSCGFLCDKEAMLLIELDGFKNNVEYEQNILKEILIKNKAKNIIQTTTNEENENIWKSRRSAFSALTQLKPNVITEDIVVPREKIVDVINKISELSKKYNIITATMGHIADGNIHPNFALDIEKEKDNFEKLKDELYYYVLSLGGTLSGEHGIGTHKQKYIKDAIDKNALKLMKEIKYLIDPNDIFNTGKSL